MDDKEPATNQLIPVPPVEAMLTPPEKKFLPPAPGVTKAP
jgi:hypothetical protein